MSSVVTNETSKNIPAETENGNQRQNFNFTDKK